ncbi:hypothetical protein GCM10009551_092690 [Nocardiopsis tropica]
MPSALNGVTIATEIVPKGVVGDVVAEVALIRAKATHPLGANPYWLAVRR